MERLLKTSVILLLSISLAGCSGGKPETESDFASSAVIPSLEALESSALKSGAIEDIPDIEGFSEVLQGVAAEMGIEPIETLTYIDCDDVDGGTRCAFMFPYGGGSALAYFGYNGEKWLAAYVVDSKEIKVYWLGDGMENLLPPQYKSEIESENQDSSVLTDLDKVKEEAEKIAANSKEITDGDLYDAITAIYPNVKITDMGESILIMISIEHDTIESDSATLFYLADAFLNGYALENDFSDVSFSMSVDGSAVGMLTLLNYKSPVSYDSSFVAIKSEYSDTLNDVYNDGFLSHDLKKKYSDALNDIAEEYGIK